MYCVPGCGWLKLRDEVGTPPQALSHGVDEESGPSARIANQLASYAQEFDLILLSKASHTIGSRDRNSTRPVPLRARLHDLSIVPCPIGSPPL